MKTKPEKSKSEEPKKETSYPVYDLSEALKIAEAIKELGGSRASVAKIQVAKKLNYAQSGPSFFQRVGAAKVFGLIDGWGEYSLTQLGKEYFYPTAEGMKEAALMRSFTTPPLFNLVASRFDADKLPDNETLGNIMHTEGVNDSWKERVAAIFVRSAQAAGALDANGLLNCTPGAASPANTPPPLNPPGTALVRPPPPKGTKEFNFDFDGKTVSLIVSADGLHMIQWKALDDYVQSLKPAEIKKEGETP